MAQEHGGCFTWSAAADEDSGGGKEIAGGCNKGDDDEGCGSSSAPSCWVEVDFGEVVTVDGLDLCPLDELARGEDGARKGKRTGCVSRLVYL